MSVDPTLLVKHVLFHFYAAEQSIHKQVCTRPDIIIAMTFTLKSHWLLLQSMPAILTDQSYQVNESTPPLRLLGSPSLPLLSARLVILIQQRTKR